MKNMTLGEIAKACKGIYYGDSSFVDKAVNSVVIDSRLVEKDSLYIAIKGARVDGHSFIPSAIKDGALCAISEIELDNPNYPYILVPSSEKALVDLAEHYRRALNIKVVGITGSVGKTSTKEMMASVFSQKYSVQKTPGNFNNEIGLPLTIFSIREEHEIAVLEMGISKFGDMDVLSWMAKPDVCVLTNIGVAHIEHLKTRDGILKEKSQIFKYMNPEGHIFLNGDDDKLITIKPYKGIVPTYYGLGNSLPFYATDIVNKGLKGTTATYHTPKSSFTAHINVPGTFMVYNALAATCVGYSLEMTDEQIVRGIEALTPIAGRSYIIETDKYTIIDDCYNASPPSMRSALELLEQATTRRVAILGDMFELGEKEIDMHFEIGAFGGDKNIELIICVGQLAKHIYEGCKSRNHTNILYFCSKDEFFKEIHNILAVNDTILLKASNGMAFCEIVNLIKES
jgi:UDP-N-acetylmuramoyl-tripeptide--D-alanyl-D-alanine ligase